MTVPRHDVELEIVAAEPAKGTAWAVDRNGCRWFVKSKGGNRDWLASELLANAVYRALGARAPVAGWVTVAGGSMLGYKAVAGEHRQLIGRPSAVLGQHYMADALIANRDFARRRNVLWDGEPEPIRIDHGCAFEFRSLGERKPYGPVPTEVWKLLTHRRSVARGRVALTERDMRRQASNIGPNLGPYVNRLVDTAGFLDAGMRERVRECLAGRVDWMRRFGSGQEALPAELARVVA